MSAPEYCFLWIDWWPLCMTKAEWSGWAQAVGAIIALVIAIGLPLIAKRDAQREAKAAARAFSTQLATLSSRLVEACDQQRWDDFDAHRHALADACSMAQVVPIAALRVEALAAHMTIRAVAIEIYRRSAAHDAGGHWAHWRNEFASFREDALRSLEVID